MIEDSKKKHDKYLPIGSVVMLKNEIILYAIAGYNIINEEDNKTYEYVSIPYPYGLISVDALCYFNHDDIDAVLSVGYKNDKYDIVNKILNRKDKNESK